MSCHNDPVIDTSGSNFIITVIDPMGNKVPRADVYFYTTEKQFLEYNFNTGSRKTDIYGNVTVKSIYYSNSTCYFRIFNECLSNNIGGAITSIDSLRTDIHNYLTVQLVETSTLTFQNFTNDDYSIDVAGIHKFNMVGGEYKWLFKCVPVGKVKIRILQLSGFKAVPKDTTFYDMLSCEHSKAHAIL